LKAIVVDSDEPKEKESQEERIESFFVHRLHRVLDPRLNLKKRELKADLARSSRCFMTSSESQEERIERGPRSGACPTSGGPESQEERIESRIKRLPPDTPQKNLKKRELKVWALWSSRLDVAKVLNLKKRELKGLSNSSSTSRTSGANLKKRELKDLYDEGVQTSFHFLESQEERIESSPRSGARCPLA